MIGTVPALVAKTLCLAVFGVLFPASDIVETSPVRDCDADPVTGAFDAQETGLLFCQFQHPFCHLFVAVACFYMTHRRKDDGIVGRFRSASDGHMLLPACDVVFGPSACAFDCVFVATDSYDAVKATQHLVHARGDDAEVADRMAMVFGSKRQFDGLAVF